MEATIVMGEDWEGLYLDGQLISEGSRICIDTVLEHLGYKRQYLNVNQMWLEDNGLPMQLEAIPHYEQS